MPGRLCRMGGRALALSQCSYQSPRIAQVSLLELWLATTVLYFGAGFLILVGGYRCMKDARERRGLGTLTLSLALFAIIMIYNVATRNTPGPLRLPWAFYAANAHGL